MLGGERQRHLHQRDFHRIAEKCRLSVVLRFLQIVAHARGQEERAVEVRKTCLLRELSR